jgi:hypothetical protein
MASPFDEESPSLVASPVSEAISPASTAARGELRNPTVALVGTENPGHGFI